MLILLILVYIARHAQITQNNKFEKSLQYLKRKVRDEVVFCADEHQRFLYFWNLCWCYHFWWAWSGMPKGLKMTNMQHLCNMSRKNWVMKLRFYMLISMEIFRKLILLFLLGLVRYAQSTWAGLQYPCDILRKKSEMNVGA